MLQMSVAGDEHEVMLERDGGYPEVVVRDRASPTTKRVFDFPVNRGARLLAGQHVGVGREAFEPSEVRSDPRGLPRPEVELPEDRCWDEQQPRRDPAQPLEDACLFLEGGYDCVGVEEEPSGGIAAGAYQVSSSTFSQPSSMALRISARSSLGMEPA